MNVQLRKDNLPKIPTGDKESPRRMLYLPFFKSQKTKLHLFYQQKNHTQASELTPITSHSNTACISERIPTLRSTPRESPAPIKNNVSVSPLCANQTILPVSRAGNDKNVFASMASTNKKINQGIYTLSDLLLKINDVTNATGMKIWCLLLR